MELLIKAVRPSTVIIRATEPIKPFARPRTHSTGTLQFNIHVINETAQPWVSAIFELQEVVNQPSVFGDGLSFDQRREGENAFGADAYSNYRLDFEPYDR